MMQHHKRLILSIIFILLYLVKGLAQSLSVTEKGFYLIQQTIETKGDQMSSGVNIYYLKGLNDSLKSDDVFSLNTSQISVNTNRSYHFLETDNNSSSSFDYLNNMIKYSIGDSLLQIEVSFRNSNGIFTKEKFYVVKLELCYYIDKHKRRFSYTEKNEMYRVIVKSNSSSYVKSIKLL